MSGGDPTRWNDYEKLVLTQLERLEQGQEKLRRDMDDRFKEIFDTLNNFKNTENEVKELKKWKESVIDVWSITQMKEVKDEVYDQKNTWQKVVGVGVAIQILWVIITLFKDKIF